MLNLWLVHEFGMQLPNGVEYSIDIALNTLSTSPKAWDAGLAKYGETIESVRLQNQLFGFIPEIERAIVNIVEADL